MEIGCIKDDNLLLIEDKNKIPEIFNKFFTSLKCENAVSSIESKNFIFNNFKEFKNIKNLKNLNTKFSFKPISLENIERYLNKIDNNSSSGVSLLPFRMEKLSFNSIGSFLMKIFNDCIESGVFIDE